MGSARVHGRRARPHAARPRSSRRAVPAESASVQVTAPGDFCSRRASSLRQRHGGRCRGGAGAQGLRPWGGMSRRGLGGGAPGLRIWHAFSRRVSQRSREEERSGHPLPSPCQRSMPPLAPGPTAAPSPNPGPHTSSAVAPACRPPSASALRTPDDTNANVAALVGWLAVGNENAPKRRVLRDGNVRALVPSLFYPPNASSPATAATPAGRGLPKHGPHLELVHLLQQLLLRFAASRSLRRAINRHPRTAAAAQGAEQTRG